MKIKSAKYVSFHEDVEPRLCEIMEIDIKYFRRYHELQDPEGFEENFISRKYFDLWHVWLWYVDGRVLNGCISDHYVHEDDDKYSDYFKKYF